jgi:Tol biopolymer transport system component
MASARREPLRGSPGRHVGRRLPSCLPRSALGLAKPRILTQPALWAAYPDWSPSGDLIVFSTHDLSLLQDTDDVSNLHTIRPDGTDQQQLTTFKAGETRATQPAWSSGGTRIIFTAVGQPRGSNRLVAFANADGSNVVVTSMRGTHSKLRPTP